MKELQGDVQQQFEQKLKELQQKYPQIKESEARRIFFGSWSEEYYAARLKQIQEFEQKSQSFSQKLVEEKAPLIVGTLHGEFRGPMTAWNQFELTLETASGPKTIKKIDCRYLFRAQDEEKFRQGVRLEKIVVSFNQRAEFKWIGDDFLFKFNCGHRELILLKTYNGESFMGKVIWYDKYDILFSLTTRVEVLLFRHAIFKFCKWSTMQKKKMEQMQKRRSGGRGGPRKPYSPGGGGPKRFPYKSDSRKPYSPNSNNTSSGSTEERKPYQERPQNRPYRSENNRSDSSGQQGRYRNERNDNYRQDKSFPRQERPYRSNVSSKPDEKPSAPHEKS